MTTTEEFQLNVVELPTAPSSSRIIGGTPTSIQNFPYTVQVLYNMQLICGGSLLTTRHVLSAAHCFVDDRNVVARPSLFAIRAGTTNLNAGGTVYYVTSIRVHERYNQPVRDNDVAVVTLSSSVTLSNNVQTAKIPVAGAVLPDNTTVVVVGWGRTNPNIPSASSVLNEVSVRTVNNQVCAQRYQWLESLSNDTFPVTDSMLCAGLLDIGGADACSGDSGGPLNYGDVVVGITSWGFSCAQPLFPGVYARVSSYTTWINQTVSSLNGAPSSHSSIIALLIPLIFTIMFSD